MALLLANKAATYRAVAIGCRHSARSLATQSKHVEINSIAIDVSNTNGLYFHLYHFSFPLRVVPEHAICCLETACFLKRRRSTLGLSRTALRWLDTVWVCTLKDFMFFILPFILLFFPSFFFWSRKWKGGAETPVVFIHGLYGSCSNFRSIMKGCSTKLKADRKFISMVWNSILDKSIIPTWSFDASTWFSAAYALHWNATERNQGMAGIQTCQKNRTQRTKCMFENDYYSYALIPLYLFFSLLFLFLSPQDLRNHGSSGHVSCYYRSNVGIIFQCVILKPGEGVIIYRFFLLTDMVSFFSSLSFFSSSFFFTFFLKKNHKSSDMTYDAMAEDVKHLLDENGIESAVC